MTFDHVWLKRVWVKKCWGYKKLAKCLECLEIDGLNMSMTPYEVLCSRCKIPLSPYANCICKYPTYDLRLNRCIGCLKSERRHLRESYRDFVWQHPEISDDVRNELWKWLTVEMWGWNYHAIVIVANV